MFRHRIKPLIFTVVLLGLVFIMPFHGNAEAEDSKLNIPFAVSPVMPDNQHPGISGYFDLNVKPESKQVIHVSLKNESERALVIDITPANAITALNGGIQYTADEEADGIGLLDQSFAVKKYINVEPQVSVPKGAVIDIPVTVSVPDRGEGTLLGGLLFSEKVQGDDGQVNKGGNSSFTVKNRVMVAIAIQLDLPVSASPKLSFEGAGIQEIPSGPQLYIAVKNDTPAIAKGISGSFEVSNASGTVMKGSFGPFTMAPKTGINYPVFWNNDMVPGKYNVRLSASYGDQNISDVKSFEIGSQEIKNYQDITGRNPVFHTVSWWIYALGGILLILLMISVYLFGRRQGRLKSR